MTHFDCAVHSMLTPGDCDNNFDCENNLICFQRNENEPIPGCIGGANDGSRTDYCVLPDNSTPTLPPTPPPILSPTPDLRIKWSTNFPLTRCQGKIAELPFACPHNVMYTNSAIFHENVWKQETVILIVTVCLG